MNFTEYALKNKALVYFFVFVLVVGGVYSFFTMSKLEDPAITVKQALVITTFPGASAYQVELEVTDVLEKSIRSMGDLDHVSSLSMDDVSMITVELSSTVPLAELQQNWDILRRKVANVQAQLPEGANASLVMDDFGDVYGMFYAMTSDGFGYQEMSDYAELVRRTVLDIDGVSSVDIYGERQACINIDIREDKMANLGVHPAEIIMTLNGQNKTVYSGYFDSGEKRIRVNVDGAYKAIEDIRNLLIKGHEQDQIRLSDVATITKGYVEPQREGLIYDTIPAIAISIAMEKGGNIIQLGKKVDEKLAELKREIIPAGIDFQKVFFQPTRVQSAINVFMVNLIESVLIVILVVMLFMGFRSGYIIGIGLVVVVLGSFVILHMMHGTLQRVSLASFIVAMGMLVDNAIVITDGILVDLKRGLKKPDALVNITKKTAWPLLGATTIGILTFLPIYLSPDTTGEYVRDLFIVLAVSLWLSWVLALAYVPIQADRGLKVNPAKQVSEKEMYDTKVYRMFRGVLQFSVYNRIGVLAATVVLLLVSVYMFRYIKQGFFPDLSYNQLYIEYKMPYGTNPQTVKEDLASIERYLSSRPEITMVTTSLGGTPSRYNLVRTVAEPALSYGELIVDFTSPETLKANLNELQKYLSEHYPSAYVRMKQYNLMYMDYPVQFMISGPDPAVLKRLCAQVEEIMRDDSTTMLVTNDWGPMTPALNVEYYQPIARVANLSREDVGMALLATTDGLPVGSYYEGQHDLPIYVKSVGQDNQRLGKLGNVPVWSLVPSTNLLNMETIKELISGMISADELLTAAIGSTPLNQATNGINAVWEVPVVRRYNGQRSISAQCNNAPGYTSNEVRNSLLTKIDTIQFPPGYTTEWQGEYLASTQSKQYLFKNVPVAIVLVLAILIALFKDFKRPAMILLCLPLAITGVVFGMLLAGKEFGFVAIVGALGLVGMMIKNGVVLVDEVDIQIRSGKDPFQALLDASSSRLRPVFLAAMTTILGMIPLVNDDMFGALAVTIMGGLFIGTVITLVILPVLYSLFLKIKHPKREKKDFHMGLS
ncbi:MULTISPECIES: efflux RND transporter permease subunit [Porphyromonadaceae]|uniref:Multidrug transporter AcrB n=1 Tax=Sanguibacteroides justesenii TaxID=1547597 RepID=A0A0C3R4X5_9PORP|nr:MULTISPECIES: efflux RND transporter permease subunit [Porphyromonadaceae]KIO44605.1 multidrug transporter AcrB [Sanguibacteroides justesenii]KIO45141.1 multidrug transporter AcrB [Sanguibacteroides justesenii]PXZ44439.1 AcrB/AcrD/AcrF family protein [Sanguibacteroides justesenii]